MSTSSLRIANFAEFDAAGPRDPDDRRRVLDIPRAGTRNALLYSMNPAESKSS